MTKVFICYARDDLEVVSTLFERLQKLAETGRFEIFIDLGLEVGDVWRSHIERALGSFDVAVVCVSKSWAKSEFIQSVELPSIRRAAIRTGAKIIPVLLPGGKIEGDKWLKQHQVAEQPNETNQTSHVSAATIDAVIEGILRFAEKDRPLKRFVRRNIFNWRFSVPSFLLGILLTVTTLSLAWLIAQPPQIRATASLLPLSFCRAEPQGSSVQLFENGWLVARFETDDFLSIAKTKNDEVRWRKYNATGFTKGAENACPEDPSSDRLRLGFRWLYCQHDPERLQSELGLPLSAETRAWIQFQSWSTGELVHGLPSTLQGIDSGQFQQLTGAFLEENTHSDGDGTAFAVTDGSFPESAYCAATWYPAQKDQSHAELHQSLIDSGACPEGLGAMAYVKSRFTCSVSGY